MPQRASARRSDGAGRIFIIVMLGVVVFLVLLLLYFKDHQGPGPVPRPQSLSQNSRQSVTRPLTAPVAV